MKNNKLETIDYIDMSKDWYYVHGYNRTNHNWYAIVVFAKTKKEAREKAEGFKTRNNIGNDDIYFYRNNYKPEARALVSAGRIIK